MNQEIKLGHLFLELRDVWMHSRLTSASKKRLITNQIVNVLIPARQKLPRIAYVVQWTASAVVHLPVMLFLKWILYLEMLYQNMTVFRAFY